MDKTLHHVADLPGATRLAVEALIGHPLRDDQHLYIRAIDPAEVTAEENDQAWDELADIINAARENVRKSGVPTDEIERLVDAACEEVRYGKRT